MSKKWDKIADRQYASLDADVQADWADLREIVQNR